MKVTSIDAHRAACCLCGRSTGRHRYDVEGNGCDQPGAVHYYCEHCYQLQYGEAQGHYCPTGPECDICTGWEVDRLGPPGLA